MADKVDKQTRSKWMAAVKSRGNKSTEQVFRNLLRFEHLTGWRRHWHIIGRPDFCWPRERVAVFVDGCFWHGCPRCYKPPKSNISFWQEKIAANRKRDRRQSIALRKAGWAVLRVWECRLRENGPITRLKNKLISRKLE